MHATPLDAYFTLFEGYSEDLRSWQWKYGNYQNGEKQEIQQNGVVLTSNYFQAYAYNTYDLMCMHNKIIILFQEVHVLYHAEQNWLK